MGKVGVKGEHKSLGEELIDRRIEMRNDRSHFDEQYEIIRDLVRPVSPDFNQNAGGHMADRGDRLHDNIFDGTAIWAAEQLANGIHSFILSPQERWFHLAVKGASAPQDLPDALKIWLEDTSDGIYHHLNIPRVNFAPAFHEFFLDLVSFGTAVMMVVFDNDLGIVRMRPYPLADCFLEENGDHEIDTVCRDTRMTARQIIEKFGESNGSISDDIRQETDTNRQWTVSHMVTPRKNRDFKKRTKTNKKFASYYFCEETGDVFEEGGFDTFPYIVARWSKLAGEKYGRSPAMSCLPDIQMVNRMMKEIIISAQLANRPPIVLEEDGFLLPISQRPGSLMWKEQGVEFPQPLNSGIRVDIPFEVVNEYRNQITRCFLIDFLKQEFKKERQTAFEIADARDEKLRAMSPSLSRMEIEVLGPFMRRILFLLNEAGIIGSPPEKGLVFEVVYNSPASRAQTGSKAVEMGRFVQEIVPMANVFPEMLQAIHPERFTEEYAKARSISPKILRTEVEITQMKEAQAQQQQMAQMTETMPAMSKALKDITDAQATGAGQAL